MTIKRFLLYLKNFTQNGHIKKRKNRLNYKLMNIYEENPVVRMFNDQMMKSFYNVFNRNPTESELHFVNKNESALGNYTYASIIFNNFYGDNKYIPTRSEFINDIKKRYSAFGFSIASLQYNDFNYVYNKLTEMKRNEKIDSILS